MAGRKNRRKQEEATSQPQFSSLQEIGMIIQEISAYEARLNELGFELSLGVRPIGVAPVAGQIKTSKKKRSSGRNGPGNYWKIITKIAKEKGITKGEARKIYAESKGDYNPKTGRKKPTTKQKAAQVKKAKFGKKMSGVMKTYHAAIDKIMEQNGCDRPTARKIYAKQKQAA